MTASYWFVLFVALGCGSSSPVRQDEDGGFDAITLGGLCVPACRLGFACVRGACRSCCNPDCAGGWTCRCTADACEADCSGTWDCVVTEDDAGTAADAWTDGGELPDTAGDATVPGDASVELDDFSPRDPEALSCSDCGGPYSAFGAPVSCYRGVVVYSNGSVPEAADCTRTRPGGGDNDSLACASGGCPRCGTVGWRTPHGLAYQCVEFVRRFYARMYPSLSMPCCGHARSYWPGRCGGVPSTFDVRENGRARTPPQPDDIVVFDGTYGHIGVIREVRSDSVVIVSQNV